MPPDAELMPSQSPACRCRCGHETHAAPPLPMTRGRDGRPRLGRRRRRLRHRRRLRRSSQLRHGDPGPRAGGGRLSRRHPQPARLALVRAVAAVRPAAAVLRHQRRQHGLADQPLHGQQEGPQRRRLLARRPDRPAARPGHAALLPPRPRGISRRAGHRRRRRGVAAPAGPLRLLERHRPPLDPARLPRPTCVVYGMGETADRRDRPAPRRRARRCATCATCAASPMRWGRSESELSRATTKGRERRTRSCCPATRR